MNYTFDPDLMTPEQKEGKACGMCGFDYSKERLGVGNSGRAHVSVGQTTEGDFIVACAETCVPRVANLQKLFEAISESDMRLILGYIEVHYVGALMEALDHLVALKASGEIRKVREVRMGLA